MFRSEVSEEEQQIVKKDNLHYEGTNIESSSNVCRSVENIEDEMVSTFFATTEFEIRPEAVSSKEKSKKERKKRKTCRTVKSEDRNKTKKKVDTPKNAPDVVHVCTDCSKKFKTRRTYLGHIKTCTNKKRDNRLDIENKTKGAGEMKWANTEEEKELPEDPVAFESALNEESVDYGDAFNPKKVFESDNALNDPSMSRNSIDGNDHCQKSSVNIKIRHGGNIAAVGKASKKRGFVKTKKLYECIQCQKRFNYPNSLRYHLQVHDGERPYQCETCGQRFFSSSALKVHSRIHSGEKPYKCDHCGRQFRQWGDLNYHFISIHSDIRKFQCEFCGKDFARKYSLTVHRRIHTGERDYKCEFCEKDFRSGSYLNSHRRIHTGEKPYACTICGKPFRINSDLKRHMMTHSGPNNRCRTTETSVVEETATMGEVTASEEQQALKNESKPIQGRGTLQIYERKVTAGDLSGGTQCYLTTAVSSTTLPSAELKEVFVSCPGDATLQTVDIRDTNLEVLYVFPDYYVY